MQLMQRRVARTGYAVMSYSYPTVRVDLQTNAERLARYCNTLECETLHLVGHSMGGLVALRAAALTAPPKRGRIVMIGTPFANCYSGHELERLPGGRWLLGRSMAQWLKDREVLHFDGLEIGVIAGNGGMGMGRLIAPGLRKPHDGVISVDETCVPGMRDHITLAVSHTAMLFSRAVVRQVCAFLQRGSFDTTAAHSS